MTKGPSSYEMPEGAGAPGRIKGRCVGHRIEIGAPPELVWDFIADFEGWQGWNPLYTHTRGRAEPGGTVRFAVKLEGMKPQKSAAQVLTVNTNELLEYSMTSFAGMLKVFRFVEVEELSPTRCAVVNGEIMGGPLGAVFSRALGEKIGQGLEGMNRALRMIAERKWSGRPG